MNDAPQLQSELEFANAFVRRHLREGGKMTDQEQQELEKEFMNAYEEMQAFRKKMMDLRARIPKLEVQDYDLKDTEGNSVKLSELFGDKDDLILVHNMGKSCPYCTLWADGFIGYNDHLSNRASFVLSSPDDPPTLKEFASGRGWNFRTVSTHDSSFTEDVGFYSEKGGYMPGVSIFKKEAYGKIFRTSKDFFGPGDYYCSVWHLFDLLPDGASGWEPKYKYD